MFGWFSKQYKIKCPDGTSRIVYKNVDDAFPMYVNDSAISLSANGKDSLGNSGAGSAEVNTKIKEMLLHFDKVNKNIIADFRSAYILFQSDPCSNMYEYEREVRDIRRRVDNARRFGEVVDVFKVSIQSCPEKAYELCDNFKSVFFEYSLTCRRMNSDVSDEISLAQKTMKELSSEGDSNG